MIILRYLFCLNSDRLINLMIMIKVSMMNLARTIGPLMVAAFNDNDNDNDNHHSMFHSPNDGHMMLHIFCMMIETFFLEDSSE